MPPVPSESPRPTDDATAFAAWLEETHDLTDVHYAVLGVGDRNWAATYQHFPTRIDERLAELGAVRLVDRVAADASGDLTGAVREFTARLCTSLLKKHGDPDATVVSGDGEPTSAYEVRTLTGGPLDALAARHGLVPMAVTEARDLTAPGHPRRKRLVRVALPDGTAYRTADHLTVLPVNAPALVARATTALRIDPRDTTTPLIMVAAGTGLAPFRGAVADRTAARATGTELAPALCYFGCDAPDADFLHAEELRAAETAGAVSLRPAFSTVPAGGVTYVQHRIAAEADEVWDLLGAGARVLVCGDGSRMAPGVREAFRTLYRNRTPGADEVAADNWINGLITDGRYVEDVYAAG